MKKLLTLGLSLLLALSLQAQNETLKITQEGYADEHGLRVSIQGISGEVNPKGEVIFEQPIDITGPMFGMVINKKSRFSGFWIEPGATEVIVRKEGFPGTTEVKGSKSHDIYLSLSTAIEDKPAFVRAFAAAPNDTVSLKYFNEIFRFLDMEIGQLRYLYEMVDEEKQSQLDNIKAYMATWNVPKVTIDRDIFDFTGQDADGKSYSTKDYRGKYLLLDFAATGCGPCWAGYPELLEENAKYENLQVLTFNQDHAIAAWQKMAESRELELPWPVLWDGADKKEVFEIYGINGWPNFFLISPEGKVLDQWMGSGGDHMRETLAKLVK